MERAIAEINEAAPGHRRLLRRPDDVRVQGGVRPGQALPRPARVRGRASSCPGNHDSRNVGYVHFEELLRRAELGAAQGRGDRRRGRLDRARPRPRPDRPRPLRMDRGGVRREPASLRVFVLHHHLLPIPGTGRERNVVYDAGDAIECLQRAGCQPRPLRAQARAVCVEARRPVRGQHRHRFDAAAQGNTRPCYNMIEVSGSHVADLAPVPVHGQERIIQFDIDTGEYEKYTGRIEHEVTAQSRERLALIDGEHSRRSSATPCAAPPVRVGRRDPRGRDREAARPGEAFRRAAARRDVDRSRGTSSTSPTSR